MKIQLKYIVLLLLIAGSIAYWWTGNRENFQFYNITPTEVIDPQYLNTSEIPLNYYNYMRVGDTHGVDLNCNNVTKCDLIKWIANDNPDILYEYVYRYDPSVNINNPIHAPRVFKMLLRNLPEKHKYRSILRKCYPMQVKISGAGHSV